MIFNDVDEITKVKEYCERVLELETSKLSTEFFYQSLPLCVIDAVYSIGVNYSSTRNTVIRYCDYFNIRRVRENKEVLPTIEDQQSISDFIDTILWLGLEKFTEDIFNNRQRTSATNGVLKSEAVFHFANMLKQFGVNYLQDLDQILLNADFEKEIKQIRGQKSGVSLQYFFMLAGSDDFIKPDRMILRFLEDILDRKVILKDAQILLTEVSNRLNNKFKHMTPRLLDHQIWQYESTKKQ